MKEIPGLCYASPYSFTPKQRLLLRVIPPVMSSTIRLLMSTCRVEVRGQHYWDHGIAVTGHMIIAIWHESMGIGIWFHRHAGFHTLTSLSYDGELAARIARRFGTLAIRGSSSRGGSEAVAGLTEALKHVPAVGFTLDGPRGPRRVAKPGAAIVAARSGAPIIPHALIAQPAWRLPSWDRHPIPKPGARLIVAYGPCIMPPPDDSPESVEKTRLEAETALNQLHNTLEAEFGIVP